MTGSSRREWLRMAGVGAAASLIGARNLPAATAGRDPFALGVASGEPSADGLVLWTRLAPAPFDPDGGMAARPVPLRWELSATERFVPIRSGTEIADPAWGHSVHVEVDGLTADRPYWYRFVAGDHASAVGRTRTAPTRYSTPERLRLAFASCQNWEAGFYAAYRHMVRDDPDLIVFLGDYIYEAEAKPGGVRRHIGPEPQDLAGYRLRYASYKTDPLLQAAHAAAPWVTTWDDHEVANNYAGALNERNDDPAAFLRRRAAAYRAYYEHMPLRRAQRPRRGAMQLYRVVDWGRLAQFQIIDDRQYRDPPPCQAPGAIDRHLPNIALEPDCAERHDPRRSILGGAQEAWLMNSLGTTRARWNLLTQQTLMLPLAEAAPEDPAGPLDLYGTDTWAGYPECYRRIVRHWRDAATPNPVILSGDIHSFVAGDHADPDDPDRIVASEFVGGSITSKNHHPQLPETARRNPGFRFTDIVHRGYGLADLTAQSCEIAFRGLADARYEQSAIADLARFAVENGRAGLHPA